MLTLYHSCRSPGERPADLGKANLATNVAWIDLLKPEPDEVAFVQRTTGLDVPGIEDLSEIESSSRLRHQNGAIYLSAPLIYRGADTDQPLTSPVGFVLTREQLITVRFEDITSFKTFSARDLAGESDPLSSAAVFAGLMDTIADRLADTFGARVIDVTTKSFVFERTWAPLLLTGSEINPVSLSAPRPARDGTGQTVV